MLNSLRGKTALITGGSRGIGLAIAQNFARQGANTIIVGRDQARLEDALKSIRATANSAAARVVDQHDALSTTTTTTPTTTAATEQPKSTFFGAVQAAFKPDPKPETAAPQSTPPAPAKTTSHSTSVDTFHKAVQGDVSDPVTWQTIIEQLKCGNFGKRPVPGSESSSSSSPAAPPHHQRDPVHTLVNCAGIAQYSFHHMTPDDTYAQILDINLCSAMLGCKYVGKYMNRLKGPRSSKPDSPDGGGAAAVDSHPYNIINVSSILALRGGSGAAAYAASKAGILGLTSSLAAEYGALFGIRVNAIVPGYIHTDMTSGKCVLACVYCCLCFFFWTKKIFACLTSHSSLAAGPCTLKAREIVRILLLLLQSSSTASYQSVFK